MQKFKISFKDPSVVQELIGTTVKLLTCTAVMKEVSSCTVGEGVKNVGNYVYARGIEDHGRDHGGISGCLN
jgi:hypothetical protein